MKKIILFTLCLFTLGATDANAQSKKELKMQVQQMQQQLQQLQQNQGAPLQMQGYPQQQMQGYPQQQVQGYPQQQMQGYPQQQMQGYPQQQVQGYPQQQVQGYPQQQVQGYPQQQMQGYPQQQVQGYPQQQIPSPYGNIVQASELKMRQFEDPAKLREIGIASDDEEIEAYRQAANVARANLRNDIEGFIDNAMDRFRTETSIGQGKEKKAKKEFKDEDNIKWVAKGIAAGFRVVGQMTYYNPQTEMFTCEVLVEYDKGGVSALVSDQELQAVNANRKLFDEYMEETYDDYEREKNGGYTQAELREMRNKQMQNAMMQNNLDRQAQREVYIRQQDADNALRQQESNQNYNLNSQRQSLETITRMQKQRIDGEIMESNVKNLYDEINFNNQ